MAVMSGGPSCAKLAVPTTAAIIMKAVAIALFKNLNICQFSPKRTRDVLTLFYSDVYSLMSKCIK
jgi:hypothetical protein